MIIYIILIIIFLFYLFVYLVSYKINKLESKINILFKEKNNLIPSLYETTKNKINKHSVIFNEIIHLKKINFNDDIYQSDFNLRIKTYLHIHNELNFIFNVSSKHHKLLKDEKFLYLRDLIIKKNYAISNSLKLYKEIIKQYNKLIILKNLTIIGLLIPIYKKYTI